VGKVKQTAFFCTLLLFLFSLPLITAETNLLQETHGIINHSIIVETDDPDFALNLYGVVPDRVTDLKIEEQKTKTINISKFVPVEEVCKVTPAPDLNGHTPKCFKQVEEITQNFVKYFEEINPIKTVKPITEDEKTSRTLSSFEQKNFKTVFSTNDLQINAGLKTIKISWKTPIKIGEWGSSGSWFMNPSNWWDSDYEVRRALNIGSTHSEIDANYTHIITGIDSTTWNCADSNSIAVVYQQNAVQTELDTVIQGTCGVSTDMNILFKSQINIPANTGLIATDTNGYYAYINDETVAAPMRDADEVYLAYEDFEALNNGDLAGQNNWIGDTTIDVVTDVACSGGAKCAKAEGDASQDNVKKYFGTGAKILKGYISVSMKQSAGGMVQTTIQDATTEKARVPYMRNYDANDMAIYGGGSGATFTENTPSDEWRSFQTNFDTADINSYILDGANAGETVSHTAATWTEINNVSLVMVDTTDPGEFDWWDDITVYQVLDSTPTYTIGAAVLVTGAHFTVVGTDNLDPENGVNDVNRVFINTSDPADANFTWFINDVNVSSDVNFSYLFTTIGDYNVSLLMDSAGTIFQNDENVSIGTYPEIYFTDYNFTSSFSTTQPINFGNLAMSCTYFDANETLTYTFQLNDVNVGTGTYDVNQTGYAVDLNFVDGVNTIVFYCEGDSSNVTSETINFPVSTKNFYFVYDKTGVPLATSAEYTSADVNEVVAYKLGDNNVYYDLKANNQVGIYYTGETNSSLGWRVSFNDITLVTTSRTFDLDVLDVNSVPVCFYKIQPYFEQLLYSSIERDIRIQNSTNGCYHVAATTRYASNDYFSLYAYTVPLSYFIYIIDEEAGNLTINLEGGTSGVINLDAIVLKNQLSTNIIITGDSATVTKNCGTSADCNTFIITYRNLATNNSSVKFTIFNGTTTLLTHTETTNPNNFTYIFDSTTLDFNADILTLRLEKTRTDGTIDIETIYFTPQGDIGFLDPTLVLIFSFLLFISGITLATARFTFGWFGIVIGFITLVLLSFSIGLWWITFLQGVMLMMLIYMGIVSVKQQGVF